MSTGVNHSIKMVSLKTGLSPHLIRVWERRYGAVTPARTCSRRRMYSEQEVERLKLLQVLTGAGHSIGRIATLGIEELQALCRQEGDSPMPEPLSRQKDDRVQAGARMVVRALDAIAKLDQAALEALLDESAVALGSPGVLLHVVAPLAEAVGLQWEQGTIGVTHEHFASAILRTFLGSMSRPFAAHDSAPVLLTSTPTGQLHELGAMLITAAAATLGWKSTYLGASLGPQEIAGAVRQKNARAVGLSLVYPPADPGVDAELRSLARLLPKGVSLLVGGRVASSHQPVLEEIGAIRCDGPLPDFMEQLNRLREGSSADKSTAATKEGGQPGPK